MMRSRDDYTPKDKLVVRLASYPSSQRLRDFFWWLVVGPIWLGIGAAMTIPGGFWTTAIGLVVWFVAGIVFLLMQQRLDGFELKVFHDGFELRRSGTRLRHTFSSDVCVESASWRWLNVFLPNQSIVRVPKIWSRSKGEASDEDAEFARDAALVGRPNLVILAASPDQKLVVLETVNRQRLSRWWYLEGRRREINRFVTAFVVKVGERRIVWSADPACVAGSVVSHFRRAFVPSTLSVCLLLASYSTYQIEQLHWTTSQCLQQHSYDTFTALYFGTAVGLSAAWMTARILLTLEKSAKSATTVGMIVALGAGFGIDAWMRSRLDDSGYQVIDVSRKRVHVERVGPCESR